MSSSRNKDVIRLILRDEWGETALIDVERSNTFDNLFGDFAHRNCLLVESLLYTYNGEIIPNDCSDTLASFGINDEDEIRLRLVNTDGMTMPFSVMAYISFQEGKDMKRRRLKVGKYWEMRSLFEFYSEQENITLSQVQFSYYGKNIPLDCQLSIAQVGISEGEIILVTMKKVGSKAALVEKLKPRSFERRRVARDYGGVTHFGTIMNYLPSAIDLILMRGNSQLSQYHNPHEAHKQFYDPSQCQERDTTAVSFHPDTKFGSADASVASTRRESEQDSKSTGRWQVLYDDGDEVEYAKDDLIEALQYYEKVAGKDLGIVTTIQENTQHYTTRTVSQNGEVRIRHEGPVPVGNANAQFDDFVFRVTDWEKPERIKAVIDFWSTRHRIYNLTTKEVSSIVCNTIHTLFWMVKDIKEWKKGGYFTTAEQFFILKPYILTYVIMTWSSFESLTDGTSIEDLLSSMPNLKDGYEATLTLQSMMHYIHSLITNTQTTPEPFIEEDGEIRISFRDIRCDKCTTFENVSIYRSLRDVFVLYCETIHTPLDRLQFMYGPQIILHSCQQTPLALGMDNGSLLTVFRLYEPRTQLNMKFHIAQENVYCILEDDCRNDLFWISFVDTITFKTVKFQFARTSMLKKVLQSYADYIGIPMNQLSFAHRDKLLFVTSIGKKTAEDSGFDDNDTIIVSLNDRPQPEDTDKPQQPRSNKGKSKGNNKNKNRRAKRNRKKPVQLAPPVDEEEVLRKQWMDAIGRVFIEAEPRFKEIRQSLDAINLKRTKPKQKKKQSKAETVVESVRFPTSGDLGGKPGKSQFIILVGEVSNLYKTIKPKAKGNGSKKSSSKDITIDLHGMTKDEAMNKLNECLPEWIQIAMKGLYPWVIPVKIICGGGNQILSELVEGWIKDNDKVANAPKNLYS